jgi:hypothetical protein
MPGRLAGTRSGPNVPENLAPGHASEDPCVGLRGRVIQHLGVIVRPFTVTQHFISEPAAFATPKDGPWTLTFVSWSAPGTDHAGVWQQFPPGDTPEALSRGPEGAYAART